MNPLIIAAFEKLMTDGLTNQQTDGQTNRRTDRRTKPLIALIFATKNNPYLNQRIHTSLGRCFHLAFPNMQIAAVHLYKSIFSSGENPTNTKREAFKVRNLSFYLWEPKVSWPISRIRLICSIQLPCHRLIVLKPVFFYMLHVIKPLFILVCHLTAATKEIQ